MKRKILVLPVAVLMIFAAACSSAESTESGTEAETASREQMTEEMRKKGKEDKGEKDKKEESKNTESEDTAEDEESEKSEVLNLFYTEPLMSKLVWAETSARTKVEGENWTDVLQFSPSEVGSMLAYEAGAQYKVLKAKIAPEEDWENEDIAQIIVYGDGDVVLYESPDITKDTAAFDMEVDISGLQAVSIKAVSIEGGSGHVILKDAVFE